MKTEQITHTPGPWDIEEGPSGMPYISGGDDADYDRTGICDLIEDQASIREVFANARLIAAAPELLASLRELLALNGSWERGNAYISAGFVESYEQIASNARAAIAKAEGGAA